MWRGIIFSACIVLLPAPSRVSASDGEPDSANTFPAVGFYHVAYNFPGGPLETYGGCSGTLIAADMFLTAAHCTFYDTRRLVEAPAYQQAEAWVTLDPVAVDNDFRCFLKDIAYPGAAALPCDQGARNHPTFYRAHSTGITHPSYPEIRTSGNGSLAIQEPFAPHNTDVGIVLLAEPIGGVTPLATASLHSLDAVDRHDTPAVGVGYGQYLHKSIPTRPSEPGTNGPTDFLGDYGVRRIAELGTVQTVTRARITPTQQSSHGDDSVCYWDSGSPLFLVQNGAVVPIVVGVLTGGALWCQGSHDPYARLDTEEAIGFLDCIAAAATARAACECGVEGSLGLCEGL